MKLYYIKDWAKHFENNVTRKLDNLRWWPKPNKHDGLGFRKMASRKNCCELYAAWNLIVDLASKTSPPSRRGYLERDGIPLSADEAGLATGFPGFVFEEAFAFFSSPEIQWLCVENPTSSGLNPDPSGFDAAEGRKEGRKEGREVGGGEVVASLPLAMEILNGWNAIAPVKCLAFSDKRRHHLSARLKDAFFRDNWKMAIRLISESEFCCGSNDRGWKATFDWFLQPDTVVKVLEGKYKSASSPVTKPGKIAV